MQRDTTVILGLVRDIRAVTEGNTTASPEAQATIAAKWDKVEQMLTDEDARETRLEPHLRKKKR